MRLSMLPLHDNKTGLNRFCRKLHGDLHVQSRPQERAQMTRAAEAKITLEDIHSAAKRLSNWGRWGPKDEIGTLNNVSSKDIVEAARLIRKGKVFSLALNFDNQGPQNGLWGNRFNPIHTMLTSGVDAVAGRQEAIGLRYADDM